MTGQIQNITATLDSTPGDDVIVSLTWLPPDNENETVIDYYEVVLSGLDMNSTTFKVPADAPFPYKFVLPAENFTTARVTVVDNCGQRSNSTETRLVNVTPARICPSLNANPSDVDSSRQRLQSTVTGLSSTLGLILGILLFAAVIVIIVFVVIVIVVKCLNTESWSPQGII